MNDQVKKTNPGTALIVFTILAAIGNAMMGTVDAVTAGNSFASAADFGEWTGYMLATMLLIPGTVVALFQIGKRFRNPRSRWKVFMWTSVLVFFSKLASLIGMIH